MTEHDRPSHAGRRIVRTFVAVLIGALPVVPEVLAGAHLDTTAFGVQIVAVTTAVTTLLTRPSVEAFLARFAPWLTAAPKG